MKKITSNDIRFTSIKDLNIISDFFNLVKNTKVEEIQYKDPKGDIFMVEHIITYHDCNDVLLATTKNQIVYATNTN